MANVDRANGFQIAYTTHGGPPAKLDLIVDESQTIVKGDPVFMDPATQRLQIATEVTDKIAGIAAHDITTEASEVTSKLTVLLAVPENIFVGQCSGTPAVTNILKDADIEGTTGIFEVNEDADDIKLIKILGIHPSDEIDANARVFFMINPASSQLMS